MPDLRRSIRGANAFAYALLAFIAFIVVIVVAVLFPALFLAFLFFIVGLFILYVYRAHPYGLIIGAIFLVLAAVFGFLAVGNALSLSLIGGRL